jgi:hypothetical protein
MPDRDSSPNLVYDLLSFLMDSPESFSVMHQDLTREHGYTRDLDPSTIIETLIDLEHRGWVRNMAPETPGGKAPAGRAYWDNALNEYDTWLGHGSRGTYFDEFGPWSEITERGKAEWHRLSGTLDRNV